MNTNEEIYYEKQNKKVAEATALALNASNGMPLNKTELRKVIWLQKLAAKMVAYHMTHDTYLLKLWANKGRHAGKAIELNVQRMF